MVAPFLSAFCAAAFGAVACQQDAPTAPRPQASVRVQVDTALAPAADAYLRSDQPNANFGTATVLPLAQTGQTRSLLRWDTAAIRQAVGFGTLDSARLELTISFNDNNWGTAGRTVNLHRLTQAWTEGGATWHCADDAVPSNQEPDCSGPTQWSMGSPTAPPFEATASAGAVITNGQSGVVALNVTADVAAVLAGSQTHYGWVLKKAAEDSAGQVRFGSRESAAVPRLVLAVQDTSRPPIPLTFVFPRDTSLAAQSPSDTATRYYRNVIGIVFAPSASGPTVRSVLQRYGAAIVGGAPYVRAYIVSVPDPGPTFAALDTLILRITGEPGVEFAFPVAFRERRAPQGRYPRDGAGSTRTDWFTAVPSDATWALRAIRATLAWGCETGTYGGPPPRVGVLDHEFNPQHPDLVASVGDVIQPDTGEVFPDSRLLDVTERWHGNAVAGMLTATGDNGVAIAGVIWRSDLRLFATARGVSSVPDKALFLVHRVFPRAESLGVRVLVNSTYFGTLDRGRDSLLIRGMRQYLSAGRGNLFVNASGNQAIKMTLESAAALRSGVVGTFAAAASLFLAANRSNILFVGGTERDGTKRVSSNDIEGAMEVVAPAADMLALDSAGTWIQGGTSVAAPLVAGVAAQLLAMDSTLSAADLKGYLIEGSRQPRLNPDSGTLDPSRAVKVTGYADQPYQLDAYGSLTLLARERPGTPICGYPVRVGDDFRSVKLEPPGENRPAIPVPGATNLTRLSVAQGGRLISAYDDRGDPSLSGSITINLPAPGLDKGGGGVA